MKQTSSYPLQAVRGNYADPSVIRVGGDYYMTHTSYKYLPGLLIWHSRDLINWKPVSAALHQYVGDVWAPDFAEHNGTYYIYFPANRTNWVITAPSPLGPWSEPIDLKIRGIDPGHIAAPDGKRYLHLSGGDFVELAPDGLSVIESPRHVYEGWNYPEDWVVEAFSMEGPKVTYRDGYYYLTVAEGGTAGPPTSHMAVSSRSVNPWGPWEHSPYNPIVRTLSRDEHWWSIGHASLIDTPDGDWWMVYHGYLNSFHTLGRQTLIEPVEFTEDGWFKPSGTVMKMRSEPDSGMPMEDDFTGIKLGLQWQCNGHPPEERFRVSDGALVTVGRQEKEKGSPLLYMPGDESYEVTVEIASTGEAEGRLVLYYNDEAQLGLGVSMSGIRHFRSFKSYKSIPVQGSSTFLRIRNQANIVTFYYSEDGVIWNRYDKTVDASGLHHNTLGGFLSLRIGLDAVGDGTAVFRRFRYRPIGPKSGEDLS